MDLPTTSSTPLFHFISGSFRSLSLFLLAFDPVHRTVHHVQTISTLGPHQYLATNQHKDRIFTTTWAEPPSLQSWALQRSTTEPWRMSLLDQVPITATSSYIDIPAPFTYTYSVGGPTGEVHSIDETTGGFGKKTQEILFVPEADLPFADKTRVALRYGSHGVESTSTPSYSLTFVPVLGTNSIEVYSRDIDSGSLTHLCSTPSPRGAEANDGPRHVKLHPNGKLLYCVTEHSNIVDIYEITSQPTNVTIPFVLKHVDSRSMLPDHIDPKSLHDFRGDTLLLTPPTAARPSPDALFTTTRGRTSATRGWLSIFALDENGYFETGNRGHAVEAVIRYETPTSGGKANAIDLLTKRKIPSSQEESDGQGNAETDDQGNAETGSESGTQPHKQVYLHSQSRANQSHSDQTKIEEEEDEGVWILLTDDDEVTAASGSSGVKILEWNGWGKDGVRVIAEWPVLGVDDAETNGEERMMGGSHTIWVV
ncbi:Muconate cycloisomerase 1 [Leucoagaricus sp. SymC.cos]|nr:Muconate cycloisomerase 1 [Leucoagaricus sp. SymC.cos]